MKSITICKRILGIVLICSVFVYGLMHLSYIKRPELANTRDIITGFYAEGVNTLDVVYVGTSATFSAYMPIVSYGEYGFASYDVCTNGMFENAMRFYIREIMKTQTPKVVVVDIAPFLFGHNTQTMYSASPEIPNTRYNTDGLRYSWNRFELVNAIVPNPMERFGFYFDISLYHTNEDADWSLWEWKRYSETKGYSDLPLREVFDASARKEMLEERTPFIEPDMGYFMELLDQCASYPDASFLFVVDPMFYDEEHIQLSANVNYVRDLVLDRGFDFLDLNEYKADIEWDETFDYSLDFLHYNYVSAKRITKYMSEFLVNHYDLPDHRGDEAYRQWDALYQTFLENDGTNEEEIMAEREKYFVYEKDLYRYLSYLQSRYYSSVILIPAESVLSEDAGVIQRLQGFGAEYHATDAPYLLVLDHSAKTVTELSDVGTYELSTTFGALEYVCGEDNQIRLVINGMDYSAIVDGTQMKMLCVEKSLGQIFDQAYVVAADGQWKVEHAN